MKIGLPKALLYYYYGPFWEAFFKNLDFEVVISEPTNKAIMNKGIKASVPEICVPIKIFVGHVLSLAEQNVDCIFVPRMVSIRKKEFFCPKFMGLPDMVQHSLNIEKQLLSCDLETTTESICSYKNYLCLSEKLGLKHQEIKKAARAAEKEWLEFRKLTQLGYPAPIALAAQKQKIKFEKVEAQKGQLRIGLLGYVYNMYDNYISLGIFDLLEERQAQVITFDMFSEKELKPLTTQLPKVLFWTFTNRLLEAGYQLFNSGQVDGIIHLTAFACGPDSFLGTLFELESEKTGIPFMTVRVDEHTGENHLITRVEAFTDMLRRRQVVQGA